MKAATRRAWERANACADDSIRVLTMPDSLTTFFWQWSDFDVAKFDAASLVLDGIDSRELP